MSRLVVFLVFFGLSGCISNIDRPPPAWWIGFSGDGGREADIRAALLECGSNVPGDSVEFSAPDGKVFLLPQQGLNEIILVQRCMRNAGIPYARDSCTRWKDLPACSPDAVIPVRSVANRLNSPFCQLVPRAKICQPDYDPSKVEPNTQKTPNPKSISIAPSIDPAIKLQNQVQKDSNAQMNQLLQGTGGRK
jgi:hypothetical protein